MRKFLGVLLSVGFLFLPGCTGVPSGVRPVSHFEMDRYLGTWFEIAHLPHSFEAGLEQITANYTLREDGSLRIVNKGFDPVKKEWKEAQGKGYFVNGQDQGYLKVSFWGPFYGSYIVFELDEEDYQYAFVTGHDKSYLWLLSRTPVVDPQVQERFMQRAKELGFDTGKLVFVKQH